jgi:hypothetical protein
MRDSTTPTLVQVRTRRNRFHEVVELDSRGRKFVELITRGDPDYPAAGVLDIYAAGQKVAGWTRRSCRALFASPAVQKAIAEFEASQAAERTKP